ncbi:RNA pseudouridine synthase [Clostridium thermosuccinogenes]|uniref:Pseudouridine synthase n=1 Tax=Clostridium thermosuccinogenes TaxID=84032 RepID=A0A2K2FJ00_9CLOT|nr:RNA pseudouridine synthase [Pseudoclostridium thermosuccinogenes]PNT98761.1 RNA pseudouridine synthase [Pseudoclostridium thermosuccinogenes]PNU00760.1 RNA pseudouridine synthase [Pseudoclostridium thermosuccinogenes]
MDSICPANPCHYQAINIYIINRVRQLKLKYIVDSQSSGKTVKYILKNKLELSERLIKRLKYSGNIFCNSTPVFVNATVNPGDIVEASVDFTEEENDIAPEKMDLDIVFEDDGMIVINKRPNTVVHPTSYHQSGTIANGIVYYMKQKGMSKKVRPVSRLDRDTSGLIIFAKNEFIQESLVRQMASGSFIKKYIGIVHGSVKEETGTINLPIARMPGSIMQRHVSPDGAPSVTHYKVIERLSNATCLEFRLETGRTHQIRVHCQAIGHPLIGDSLYPGTGSNAYENQPLIERQALHSHTVRFVHPVDKTEMHLTAPLPEDMSKLLEILRK